MPPSLFIIGTVLGYIAGFVTLAILAERLFVAADRFFTNNNEKK